MGRRSKGATDLIDELREQPVRRPRKKREIKVIPLGLKPGYIVLVRIPSEKLNRTGIVIGACRYDPGVIIRLSDDGPVAKYVCARPELGDTIERLTAPNNGIKKET